MCVVCDNAESSVCSVFFHYTAERHLGGGRHSVGFVENDKLEGAERGGCCLGHWCGCVGENLFGRGEGLYLFTDNINATVVGGIQFQDHLADVLRPVDLASECEDCGCFARARWTVEQEMREALDSHQ